MPPARSQSKRSLGFRWLNHLKAFFGLPAQRRLARAALQIPAIRHWEGELGKLSDAELLQRGLQLRGRARGGESLDRLLPEAFAAVCVVATRTLGLRPFDVQLAGGVVMHHGGLAELVTGEGKTLVAVLPVFLNALPGKGAHVTTVNDYLARRDAEWVGPIYQALGLSVGVLQTKLEDEERLRAYRADVTYGTASVFGFDFLRDRLKLRRALPCQSKMLAPWKTEQLRVQSCEAPVQRGHHFALVDEADNIFIDEARTPLVISVGGREPAAAAEQVVYRWADQAARALVRDRHYYLDDKKHRFRLTREGRQLVRWSNPPANPDSPAMDKLYEHVERAVHAHFRFRRDQHYLVEDHQVEIIDENTGRRMPDRHWSDGLHQAVEAKEGVLVTQPDKHAAQITFQNYFRLYTKLTGMTGTAAQNWWEMRRVYKLWVVCVPSNRPVIRKQWPDRIFPTEDAKLTALVEEVARLKAIGRPVLIGTRSVERSEILSSRLEQAGIKHQVLNARQHEQEAQIVAQAGQASRITIATNMAGRGTDIKLGPGVAEAGGLHVLGTERHEAIRIDRQLAGRAGRQGDPGSSQFFLCLEDELLEGLGVERQAYLRDLGRQSGAIDWQKYRRMFRTAQRRMERRHYHQRVDLLLYEKRRQEILKDLAADPYVE
jgi:preprotein translocase subunit SecA